MFTKQLKLMLKLKLNTTRNYSPNFDLKKRKFKNIKFLVFHYTGMKSEKKAIKRLTSFRSKVSCNYLIKNSGKMQFNVEELFKIALNGKCKVTEKEIEKLRKTCRVELQKEIDYIDNRRKKYEEYIKNKSSINEENEKKKKKNEEDDK